MIRDLWGMGIMKKTIVLTMLVLLMFDGRASLYVDAHTGEIADTLMV